MVPLSRDSGHTAWFGHRTWNAHPTSRSVGRSGRRHRGRIDSGRDVTYALLVVVLSGGRCGNTRPGLGVLYPGGDQPHPHASARRPVVDGRTWSIHHIHCTVHVLLDWTGSALWWSVSLLEQLPLAAMRTAPPGWIWVILVESCTVTALVAPGRYVRRWATGVALLLWVLLLIGASG